VRLLEQQEPENSETTGAHQVSSRRPASPRGPGRTKRSRGLALENGRGCDRPDHFHGIKLTGFSSYYHLSLLCLGTQNETQVVYEPCFFGIMVLLCNHSMISISVSNGIGWPVGREGRLAGGYGQCF